MRGGYKMRYKLTYTYGRIDTEDKTIYTREFGSKFTISIIVFNKMIHQSIK